MDLDLEVFFVEFIRGIYSEIYVILFIYLHIHIYINIKVKTCFIP